MEEKIISLTSELDLYQKRCEQYRQTYDILQHQVDELRRHRFGKKSERFIDPENRQLSLFDDNAAIFAEIEAKGEAIVDEVKIAAHTRKKKKQQTICPVESKLFR